MEPLALRDIRLPEDIGWWPPAPAWWLLPLLLILLILVGRYAYRRLTRKTAVKRAQTLLNRMRRQQSDTKQTLTELSALLRRVAIGTEPRAGVAQLHGQAWLEYLDRKLPDAPFSQGVGRCLADSHYRPAPADDADLEALFALCERWLKQRGKLS
ncbi:DUF4381 domain-containing protein [Methylomonas sp. SURF-2]|uniref:DUF4381 domain-containing protein n=1 Tax=Methylomonas subterranea TaxID=2952225 RepID=A0ABT1TD99_9GAMM|nr:DUF4381 domain-containing protein [Methylomonas sp. SURF-2]MCQ8103432.1 DUF4381 domain-containing protein [Methylomonas sp. SURF-2]